jgi:transposase-like protein/lambda repressor-like predicted transcriptional regulator
MSTECIRRKGSEWTLCQCASCRKEMRRKVKLRRSGVAAVRDQRPAARRRIAEWMRAGYSIGLLAQATGIRKATLQRQMAGTRSAISHSTAARIMAASLGDLQTGGFVPSVGTVRRLRALTAMGWSMPQLADRCDVRESTLHALRDPAHRFTRPMYANAVAALYDEFSTQRGPSQYAATRALRRGWLPPHVWDDIDDPTEDPLAESDAQEVDEVAVQRAMTGDRVHTTRAERIEATRRLAELGVPDSEIAERIGVAERSVTRWRSEFHIESRWSA